MDLTPELTALQERLLRELCDEPAELQQQALSPSELREEIERFLRRGKSRKGLEIDHADRLRVNSNLLGILKEAEELVDRSAIAEQLYLNGP